MKRMCKFIFGIIFSIFMMGIISCSGQDESTNLTIAIDMSGLLPSNESKDSFARSVDAEDLTFKVTLIDLEDENNILPLTIAVPIIDNKASVTFEKIPLFFKGRIEAIIFEGEIAIYTGRSEEFTVHEGRNQILLTLKEVDNLGDDPTEPGDPEDPADPNDPNQPGDGTGDDSGETGGNEPTEPGNPTEPENPTEPDDPGDDPAIDETEKTANYTVEHYQQNAEDNEYTLVETDTEDKTGIVGAETSAEAKNYEGFEEGVVEQKTIAEDGSTVVQIMYNRKFVKLTLDTDSTSENDAITGKYGAQVPKPENPTKKGYDFDSWDPELPDTFPAADTTFIATWTPIEYEITYDLVANDVKNPNTVTKYTIESETIVLQSPTRTGYSFEGWKNTADEIVTQITKGSTGNITLTAVWNANTYTVVFNPGVDDGSVNGEMNSISCTYDDPIKLPENKFTRENFDFDGWKDAYETKYEDCASVKNLSSTQDDVVTLYAQWHPQSKVRDVDFTVAGGDVNYGTKVTLSCETEGATIYYTFGETEYFSEDWTRYEEFEITIFGENDVDLQKTLRAIAIADGMTNSEINSQTYTLSSYTVTLNPNGGSLNETISATQNIYSGETLDLSKCIPTRTGYTFDGWELDGEIVNTVKVTNSDVVLTATWTPITYEITYVLGANDVKNPNTVTTYTIESETIVLQSPTRTGYSFEGWKDEEETTITEITKGSTGNVSLTAQWKKIESTIEIDFNGYSDVSFDEDDVTNDGSTITITIPSGYSVVAWEKDGVTINGSEEKNSITVSEWDGGIYTVTIIFKDDAGNFYSYEMQVTINKVNRAN